MSGSQAITAFREARVLSNRFTMLTDAAPQIKDGLAFNVVAKGDPRAELGNDTQYDMLALRQSLDLTSQPESGRWSTGIAHLDGDGSGDRGRQRPDRRLQPVLWSEVAAWRLMKVWRGRTACVDDVRNLDSSRSCLFYGDAPTRWRIPTPRQQYLEFRSEGAKTFTMLNDTLKVTPVRRVKFRHTLEGSY